MTVPRYRLVFDDGVWVKCIFKIKDETKDTYICRITYDYWETEEIMEWDKLYVIEYTHTSTHEAYITAYQQLCESIDSLIHDIIELFNRCKKYGGMDYYVRKEEACLAYIAAQVVKIESLIGFEGIDAP